MNYLLFLVISDATLEIKKERKIIEFLLVFTDALENGSNKGDSAANRKGPSKDDTYWKEINAAMALTNLAQGKDTLQGTTSCIIQKSSHIAEVKTVKVPLVQQF